MTKLTQLAATLAFGAVCALPAVAQDTGTTGASHGNTASEGTSTTLRGSTTPPPGISHTISASADAARSPSTRTMGAGPADKDESTASGDRTGGWMGLVALLDRLGLRGYYR